MTKETQQKAEEILYRISSQSFDDFYKGRFEDYIVGVTGEDARKEILEEIAYIFRIEDAKEPNIYQCDENHCFCDQFDEDGEILCKVDLSSRSS